ncbi:MAG: hypothetical protein GEU80_08400 [Dehalococcoidia bacterium]|nr:hypothetical protein [Dehalococcoidia bacterium]
MIERALLALVFVASFAAVIAIARAWLRRRDRRIVERLRAGTPPGDGGEVTPRIVYFTTETCVVCRVQQEPAIERLRERVPALRVERHDAVAEGVLAHEYGVLSVPTTAVYARDGELVAVNRGYAPAAVLLAQLEGLDPMLDGGAAMASDALDGATNH